MVHKTHPNDKPKCVAPKVDYYDVGGLVTLDIIRAKLTPEQYQGFLLGNIIKYSLRFNHKGSPTADAAKAAEYSQWLKEEMNGS